VQGNCNTKPDDNAHNKIYYNLKLGVKPLIEPELLITSSFLATNIQKFFSKIGLFQELLDSLIKRILLMLHGGLRMITVIIGRPPHE